MGMRVRLKKGRELSLKRHHPWVFSGAVDDVVGKVKSCGLCDVVSSEGEFLGRGFFNLHSNIRVRMLTFTDERIDREFFKRRILCALRRRTILEGYTTGLRLVFGESDGLPGLIVDKYGDFLVVEVSSLGMERVKDLWLDVLVDLYKPRGIYEKSISPVLEEEGMEPYEGVLWGQEPPPLVEFTEGNWRFFADIKAGQKTGFYLDQRESRKLVAHFSSGKRVLNTFSYTGGFTVSAFSGGAKEVVSVDTSNKALDLVKLHIETNDFSDREHLEVERDVFAFLREAKGFDVVILDPPGFARKGKDVEKATRAYKDINLYGAKALNRGGILFTFSCSNRVSLGLFKKIVFSALLDADREGRIIAYLFQPLDHPVSVYFPESEYLKGLVIVVE